MTRNKLITALKGLGLTDKEAQVYFAALSLGPTTIQKIAQAADVKRTTAYSLVESLMKKGLMNIEMDRMKKRFVAEDPGRLETVFEQRKREFQKLLPEFSALHNLKGGESFIKYYEGLDALKGVYESLIRDILPGEDYLVITHTKEWLALDEKYFTDFLHRRAKLPIKIRKLFQQSDVAEHWKKHQKNINADIKLLPKETKLKVNMVITPQKILFHQVSLPIIGIVIENKSVIEVHQQMFDIIWNSIRE